MWDFLNVLKQTFLKRYIAGEEGYGQIWEFLNVLKQTFLKRYIAVVVSLGIGGLLAWSMLHGHKPQPGTKANVAEAATDAATAPLNSDIASLHERIATLEQELAEAQAVIEQRKVIDAAKQDAATTPPKLAELRKENTHQGMKLVALRRKHRLKNAAKPTKPSRLAHVSVRGAVHPTDIAGPLIPAGAVADTPGT